MAKRPLKISYSGKQLRTGDIGETIKQLPTKIRGVALEVVAKYMLEKYKKYPRYKNVARKRAYPEVDGFFSDKQRRFVMAKIASGEIQPGKQNRTDKLKNDWRIVGSLSPLKIVNDNPAAVFAYDPQFQARQLDLVGWKDIGEMTEENQEGAFNELIKWMNKNLEVYFDKILLKKG
jgi:hypothetical protein